MLVLLLSFVHPGCSALCIILEQTFTFDQLPRTHKSHPGFAESNGELPNTINAVYI